MSMPKYTPTLKDLEQPGGIDKLEHDGFKRHEIFKEIFKQTQGIDYTPRGASNAAPLRALVSNLYDRQKSDLIRRK